MMFSFGSFEQHELNFSNTSSGEDWSEDFSLLQ